MKKLLITLLIVSGIYSQSHAMNMGRHAQRVRIFKSIRKTWNTKHSSSTPPTTPPKSSYFICKFFAGVGIGWISTDLYFSEKIRNALTNSKYNDILHP